MTELVQEPAEETKIALEEGSVLPAVGAGLAASAVAAPLIYKAIRKPRYSNIKMLADMQRKSGGRFARTIAEKQPKSKIRQFVDKTLYDVDELHYTGGKAAPKKPKKFEGSVHHFDPEYEKQFLKGKVEPISSKSSVDLGERIGDQKWKEYQYFQKHAPGSMPESGSLSGVLREMGHRGPLPKGAKKRAELLGRLQQQLRKQHPEGFVMKDVAGAQSAGMFPSETHDLGKLYQQFGTSGLSKRIKTLEAGNLTASQWDKAFKELKSDPAYSGRVLSDMFRDPASVMVQKKIPIEQVTGPRRLVGKLFGQPASKEMRVHAVGGKVDPSMVMPRYDPTMAVFERKRMREAAEYAQGIVDKLPEKHRRTGFAFDIAPLEGGGYKMIEANPGGQSGLLHPERSPFISPILRRQLTGQWSRNVAGAGAVATAGTVGTGAALATRQMTAPQPAAKTASVIGHISGASGAGKTTLLQQLAKKHPGLTTKDLDEFDEEAERQLGYDKVRKSQFTDKMLSTLADRRQKLQDDFLKKNKDKPVLLGGHHTEAGRALSIPTTNKMMLDTGPARSAWRGYRRDKQRKLSELPSDYREAKGVIQELKGMGYKPMSAAGISKNVGGQVKTAAKNGVYRGKACSADSVKKRINFKGIPICIDRPRGFIMKGVDDKGEPWTRTYKVNYGFIPKTLGGDGDGLDVFLGNDRKSDEAYWAIQTKPDGKFDEYKVFLGFPNREAAIGCYKQHIPKKFFSGLVTMKIEMMKAMLKIEPKHALKKMAMIASCKDELDKIGSKAWMLQELKRLDPDLYLDPEVVKELKKAPTRRGMRQLISESAEKLWKKGKEHVK